MTSYARDQLGRATQVTDPAGMETTSAYDMLGRRTEEVRDAAQGGLAIKTTWQHDQWDGANAAQTAILPGSWQPFIQLYYDVIEVIPFDFEARFGKAPQQASMEGRVAQDRLTKTTRRSMAGHVVI